ncbi:MAG: hypothetical protein ACYCU7_15895 [Acidimicrobiales bacterium]
MSDQPAHERWRQGLGRRAARGGADGARAAAELVSAGEALRLEVVVTGLAGDRVLAGHVIGMHQLLHAGGLHGPRETPAILYVFADALAVRPTDDAPMSTVPVLGLHVLLPPLAVARWLYKTGRIAHANVELVKDLAADEGRFEAAVAHWTVDDFAEADPKVQVYRASDLGGPVYVYDHLGFARLSAALPGGPPLRLKSTLPATPGALAAMEELLCAAAWPHGLRMAAPGEHPEGPGDGTEGSPA